MFTNGQSAVMNNALKTYRKSIISTTEVETNLRIFDTVVYDRVLIFPRAAESKVVVEIPNEVLENKVSFSLYNSIGQQVIQNQELLSNETLFDVRGLAKGYYLGVIKNDRGEVKTGVRFILD
jgi:hypothetical protein